VVAAREDITTQRLKQILQDAPQPSRKSRLGAARRSS
jgi:hypothetical protein